MIYSLILLIFLLSGMLGLGYQVLWSKFLLEFIGVSSYSYSTVLAAFMAGLALGSWIWGRLSDRLQNPLKLFAYLELGIGLYALCYLPLMSFAEGLYGQLIQLLPVGAGAALGIPAKALCAGLLLLPPTILMGGTFPALLKHVTQNLQIAGRRASQLYAINACGAGISSLVMAFVLMPSLGMRASLMLMAICNCLLGGVSLLLSRYELAKAAGTAEQEKASSKQTTDDAEDSKEGSGAEEDTAQQADDESKTQVSRPETLGLPVSLTPQQIRLGIVAIFFAGLLSFVYEIAWTRYFGLVLGSSTYSFALVLTAFITGISLGSAILSRIEHRLRNPLQFFGTIQILIGLFLILPLPFYQYVPWLFQFYGTLFSDKISAFYVYEAGKLFFCYMLMLPPTIFIGMSIPLFIKGLSRELSSLGEDTGRIYAWNTLGNVAGALAAGLFLLPLLGMEWLLRLSAIFSGALGFVLYTKLRQPNERRRSFSWSAAFLVVLVVYPVGMGSWERGWFTISPFRRSRSIESFRNTQAQIRRQKTILFKDDPAAHLNVSSEGKGNIVLYVNGKPDASSTRDLGTQLLLAHVPILLHPNPKDILVIGLASGMTAGSALKHPVRRVDTLDLVRSMPEATKSFNPWNGNPFADKRFRLIFDDARTYVLFTRQKYDVIISEPSNPWLSGVGALFTTDFYKRAVKGLKPNGIYLQWLQNYEVSDRSYATVIRSFREVFPYVYCFHGSYEDSLLLGSLVPLRPDWKALRKRIQQPKVYKDLKRIGISSINEFLFLQKFSPATSTYIASKSEHINTDDNHWLEYQAPIDLFQKKRAELSERYDERVFSLPTLFWAQYLRSQNKSFDAKAITDMLFGVGAPKDFTLTQTLLKEIFLKEKVPIHTMKKRIKNALPDKYWTHPPLASAKLVEKIDQLLKHKQFKIAGELLGKSASYQLLRALQSKKDADFWLSQFKSWSAISYNTPFELPSRMFEIDLLYVSGYSKRAAKKMLSWSQAMIPPPSAWAVHRACQIDSDKLCLAVLKQYARRGRTVPNWINRFYRLQFGSKKK